VQTPYTLQPKLVSEPFKAGLLVGFRGGWATFQLASLCLTPSLGDYLKSAGFNACITHL